MKKLLLQLVLGAFVFCFMSGSASAQLKIATVDLSRVFTNYYKTKQADAALQDQKTDLSRTDKEMLDNRQKLVDAYNKLVADANNQAVSAEERDKRKKAAEDKLKEIKEAEASIQQFEQQARTRLSEQSLRLRDNLLAEIRIGVNSKAKAGGFALVLDTAGQTADRTPFILYSTAEDLTDAVLAQLNAAAPIQIDDKKK